MLINEKLAPVPRTFSEEGHLQFLSRRLQETSGGWAGTHVDDSELVAEGVDNRFWELIGLRVIGHTSVILGAVEFRRQGSGESFARQSLPSYLSADHTLSDGNGFNPPSVVAVEIPTATESVPEFLRQLTGKKARHRVLVDKALIQVVFDLRAQNPSTEKLGAPANSMRQTVALRTRDGHVVSGNLLDLEMKLRRDLPFVALTMGVQYTVQGNIPLPTVFIHRRYISMLVATDEVDRLEDKLCCGPFQPEHANPLHLVLDS